MNERILLITSLIVSISGVCALLVIPEIPRTEITGVLTWTQETSGLVIVEESVWVESLHPIILSTPQCVSVSGRITQERVVDAQFELLNYNEC